MRSLLGKYLMSTDADPLVNLTLDLSLILEKKMEWRLGHDRQQWYYFPYVITMTNFSASMKNTLIYKGEQYDSVEAEYVSATQGLVYQHWTFRSRGNRIVLLGCVSIKKYEPSRDLNLHIPNQRTNRCSNVKSKMGWGKCPAW